MQVYLIKTENGHSHEWGGEFYYDEEEAHRRAAELYTMMEEEDQIIHFNVVKAEINETQENAYPDYDAIHCPFCESDNIYPFEREYSTATEMTTIVECEDCKKKWVEDWEFVGTREY
jgi:DNA-directed RNA polymerase subunit M/transcription elongation factor TFIIS